MTVRLQAAQHDQVWALAAEFLVQSPRLWQLVLDSGTWYSAETNDSLKLSALAVLIYVPKSTHGHMALKQTMQ